MSKVHIRQPGRVHVRLVVHPWVHKAENGHNPCVNNTWKRGIYRGEGTCWVYQEGYQGTVKRVVLREAKSLVQQ